MVWWNDEGGGHPAYLRRHRTFAFRNRKAVRNVQPRYTPDQLDTVRLRLAKKSRAQLRGEIEQEASDVTKLYRRYNRDRRGFWHSDEWRDAVAHVLLERGVLVGEAHGTALIYLDDET
jgi:hypothetical protein